MLDDILNKIDALADTDDFEFDAEQYIEQLEAENIGIEAVTPILEIMERHPLADFGMPGPLVHFVERFYKNGYEERLVESLKRRPSNHTVFMLNRIINGSDSADEYLKLLEEIADRSDIENEIRAAAKEFLEYQSE